MQGKAFGVACDDCKHVAYLFTGLWTRIQKLNETPYKYCPLCGENGISLYSMNDVADYDSAYAVGLPIGLYRTMWSMYKPYMSAQVAKGQRIENFNPWYKKAIEETLMVARGGPHP